MDGLETARRSGRPREIGGGELQRVLAGTLEAPQDGMTHWSARRLAPATGDLVLDGAQDLARSKLRLHQVRSFRFSKDPQLVENATEFVAPYRSAEGRWCWVWTRRRRSGRSSAPRRRCRSGPQGAANDPRLQAQRHYQPLRPSGDCGR